MLMTLRLNGCCRLLPALQVLLRSRSRVLQNIFTPRDTRWRAPPIMSATSGFLMRNMASQSDGLTAIAPTEFGSLVKWWCAARSEEHTSELQSLMRISYAVFCLKKKNNKNKYQKIAQQINI